MPERNKGSSRLRFSEEEQGENAEEAIQTSSNTKRLFQTKVEGQRAYSTKGKETIPSHSEERPPGDSPSKAEEKIEKAATRAEKIRTNIPKKKTVSITTATDEATGKTRLRLHLEEKPKPAPSSHSMGVTRLPLSEVHRQIGKVEEENTGVEAAHHGEEAAEKTARFAEHSYRAHQLKPYRRLEKAEQKLDKANIRSLQQKATLSSNPLSRWRQKQAIRKAYYAAQTAAGGQNPVMRTLHRIKRFFSRGKKAYALGGALFLLLALLINGLSSCTPLLQGGLQALVIATYPAEDEDILAAERYYKGLEDELQQKIDRYAAEHPQYNEFQYDLARIWHDPHALISLISAHANGEWKIDGVYGFLNRLFEEQYTLSQKVKSETRYRKEWVKHYEKIVDPETGEITWRPYQVLEDLPYTYRTCTVRLENFNLSHLPFYVLSRKGVGRYAMYISVLGNREDLFRGNPYASNLREPGKHDVPEAYLEDETFRRILEEAEKYIGYPYVWGGDSPETSFDCSGFVSYVFTNSGVRNVGRLGATSLYGVCRKITPEEARPGDLVFFEKTISGVDGITHCGIYVGDGFMLHCGSPIGYADLRDSYWQQHFFGYGRLARD